MQGNTYRLESMQLAALAHDLRTPMCCVQGAAQLALTAGEQGKDVSAQLRQILQAVHAMDGMLERMLDTRPGGTFTGDMLARELNALCAQQAAEKGQRFSVELDALGDARYALDYGALTRVLANLLGNAIKYTQTGGDVTLRAQVSSYPWKDGAAWLRFVVADNGMGMERAFLRRMYQPHARAKQSAHLPGHGLGLSITRALVRQMGGRLSAKSTRERGTAFTVIVPVRSMQADRLN